MAEETAEENNANAEGEANGADGGKSKKKLIIIIAAAVLILAGGGGAAAFFLMGSSGDVPPETAENAGNTSEKGEGHAEGDNASSEKSQDKQATAEGEQGDKGKEAGSASTAEVPGQFGETFPFKTFHLNLGNPLENHYIRLEISVEFKGGEEQKKEIEQRLPQLRDAVVGVTSRKTREFLLGPDGKDQLRREILIRMNRYMTQPLESVFLTDILIE